MKWKTDESRKNNAENNHKYQKKKKYNRNTRTKQTNKNVDCIFDSFDDKNKPNQSELLSSHKETPHRLTHKTK